jgi:hypothetical protein
MDMEVIHRLTTVGFAVNYKAGTLFAAALFHRQFLGFVEQPPQKNRSAGPAGFHDVPDMLFGNHQEVHRRLGDGIVEGQHFIILIDLPAGNFPGGNLAKNTVAHGSILAEPKWTA